MRKSFLLLAALAIAANSFAQTKEVQLQSTNDDETSGHERHNLAPTVKYDEHFVYLESHTLIPNANTVPITVAMAAPLTPSFGKPRFPPISR